MLGISYVVEQLLVPEEGLSPSRESSYLQKKRRE
jgi:hypothetical protein